MQIKNKILSYFLLATYLWVVLHHSVSHSHILDLGESSLPKHSHQHEDYKTDHHEHGFHIGIFHFLGHLFEGINHSNDLADSHLIIIHKTLSNKNLNSCKTINFYFTRDDLIVFRIDEESLPDPPFRQIQLQKLKSPNTSLRAPPIIV